MQKLAIEATSSCDAMTTLTTLTAAYLLPFSASVVFNKYKKGWEILTQPHVRFSIHFTIPHKQAFHHPQTSKTLLNPCIYSRNSHHAVRYCCCLPRQPFGSLSHDRPRHII